MGGLEQVPERLGPSDHLAPITYDLYNIKHVNLPLLLGYSLRHTDKDTDIYIDIHINIICRHRYQGSYRYRYHM